jgi:hypothetical protein
VVLHISQMAVALLTVPVSLEEVVFRKLQDDGEQHEQLRYDVVVDVPGELLDFRSVLVDDIWVGPLESWDELGNIVDLGIVKNTWTDFLLR